MVGIRPLIMSRQQELEVYNYIVCTVEEEFVLFQLERSLEDDGRFYGAEWVEEMDDDEGWVEYSIINSWMNVDGWISK